MIKIKHKTTGEVLKEVDANTLRHANLWGADLRHADLRHADLRHAYLRYADLRGANLGDADLRGADLRGAYLRGAYLGGANTTGASGIKLPTLQSQKESTMSERKFFDDTTYAEPAMFLEHATNRLWHGPVNPDSNLHWGKLEGFLDADGSPVFVYCASELPDGDYIRIETRPPKSRHELVQDLLDAIDDWNTTGRMDVSHGYRVVKAREALAESEASDE